MDELTVSELAGRAETTADTVRYYERIGLLPEAERSAAGYRLFGDDDVRRLRFIKRAQRFGLQLDGIRELLEVRERGLCPCGHARALLEAKIEEVETQLASLRRLRGELEQLLEGGLADPGGGCWPCGSELVQLQNTRPEKPPT